MKKPKSVKDLEAQVEASKESKPLPKPKQVKRRTVRTNKATIEQLAENTRIAKQLFLKAYASSDSIIKACKRANVGRSTVYDWKEEDPQFVADMKDVDAGKLDIAHEGLFKLIKALDGPSIRFYLQAKDPDFKNKTTLEHNIGNITLEDLIDADKAKDNGPNPPTTDRGIDQNSQQVQ